MGATWSWYQRKKRNIGAKFFLAISMIVVLIVFFGNLLANLNDSRLVLAQLLIQLQVLHSFDLPRRKDLGYSMVIGLILLAVAGTVSQTMLFAPCLLAFLAIALPTLILDYRSRLNLENLDHLLLRSKSKPTTVNKASFPLSWRSGALFMGVIVGIALLLFTLLPRFNGYQFQSFPVSGPESVRNEGFNDQNRNILNPGYQKGNGTGKLGNQSKATGPGSIDQTFYYGFNAKMNQNLRGEMTETTVMRVRSQAPGFWRVMAFNHYTGQGWENSRDKLVTTLNRDTWNYRFYIPLSLNGRLQSRQVIQSYSIVSSLPNLVPALSLPVSVFFPTRQMNIDTEDGLRSPSLLMEGMTYSVISQVPYRNRTLLNQASTNFIPKIRDNYLDVPIAIKERVKNKALEILATSPKPITTNYEKVLYLAQYIKQRFSIKQELPFFGANEDLVEAFLFKYQGGYRDHFSTVLTVMLRTLDIPTRLAVGFSPGQFNPFTGYYIVKNTDAHALTEVNFAEYGWFAFDPIPGHEVIPASFEEEEKFTVLKQLWNFIAGFLPSPVTAFFSILWTKITTALLKIFFGVWTFISGSLLGLFVGLLGMVGLSFLGWLAFEEYKKIQQRSRLAKLPPIERVYQQMLLMLKSQGYPKHPAQTPLEYAKVCAEHHPYPLDEMIAEVSKAYVSWRYGEEEQNVDYLRQQVKRLQSSLNGLHSLKKR